MTCTKVCKPDNLRTSAHLCAGLALLDNRLALFCLNCLQVLNNSIQMNGSFGTDINCTCDFGKTDFATWIRSHAIKGVTCKSPNRLFGKDISVTPIEEFCQYEANIATNALISTWLKTTTLLATPLVIYSKFIFSL